MSRQRRCQQANFEPQNKKIILSLLLQYVNQHAISASVSIYHVTLESRAD